MAGEPLYEDDENSVERVAVFADGRKMISVHDNRKLRIWDVETRTVICEHLHELDESARDLALNEDNRTVLCSTDWELVLLDIENGGVVWEDKLQQWRRMKHVAISGDGQTVVSGSDDGAMREWDIGNGTAIDADDTNVWYQTGRIHTVGMTGDARYVVSSISDYTNSCDTVYLWDIESGMEIGEPLHIPYKCGGGVSRVATNGRRVVTGSWDGTVRVWNKETSTTVCDPLRAHECVSCLAITADGRTVVSAHYDGSV